MIAQASPTTEELLTRYVKGKRKDVDLFNQIAEMQLPRVRSVARNIAGKIPNLDPDDFVQVGMMGVLDAMQKWDPARGLKFWTLANQRVRGEILDYMREVDPFTRNIRRGINGVRLLESEGADVTIDSLMKKAKVSKAIARDAIRLADKRTFSTADELDSPKFYSNRIPGVEDYRDRQRRSNADLRASLIDMMAQCLTDQERSVLTLYYLNGITMREVSQMHGRSEAWVSLKVAAAMKTLKKAFPEFPG